MNGSRLICTLRFTMSYDGVVRWDGSRLICNCKVYHVLLWCCKVERFEAHL